MICGLVKIQIADNQSLVLSYLLMRVPCCYSFTFFNAKKGPADKNVRKSAIFYKTLAVATVSLRGRWQPRSGGKVMVSDRMKMGSGFWQGATTSEGDHRIKRRPGSEKG